MNLIDRITAAQAALTESVTRTERAYWEVVIDSLYWTLNHNNEVLA